MKDNKTKILIDRKNGYCWNKEWQKIIEEAWRPVNDIKQARILSWHTKNTALAALKRSIWIEGIDNYEIVEMTEIIEIS